MPICLYMYRWTNIVIDLGMSILESVKVQSLENFISHWKIELWESLFFHEFKFKGGILKNKTWQQQTGGVEV